SLGGLDDPQPSRELNHVFLRLLAPRTPHRSSLQHLSQLGTYRRGPVSTVGLQSSGQLGTPCLTLLFGGPLSAQLSCHLSADLGEQLPARFIVRGRPECGRE